jgi:hypothetical protein
LQDYDYDISYIKGSDNAVADCLSRIPEDQKNEITEGEGIITHLNLLDLELVHHDPSVFGPTEDMVRATYVTVMGNQ